MCIMCVEIFKGRMTAGEARRALRELIDFESDTEKLAHYKKLDGMTDNELLEYAQETGAEFK